VKFEEFYQKNKPKIEWNQWIALPIYSKHCYNDKWE
jgi:hypothetical protein